MSARAAWIVATCLAACGDNRPLAGDAPHPRADAYVDDGTLATVGCLPTYGANIVARPIAQLPGELTLVASTPDPRDDRLFVVKLGGTIWILQDGQLLPEPFLDLNGVMPTFIGGDGTEAGLLGLAFHPDFATNRTLFVNYTAFGTDPAYPYRDVTMRFEVSATDPNKVDPSTAAVLLSIPDFATNHDGGMLAFGPDGYLYVGDGDGGGANDPMNTAQDPQTLLGKISRIDVDHHDPGKEYGIPPGNPFADGTAGLPEIYIRGVREPWRFSFDRATGDLWIGDVGQADYEELDVLHPGEQAGANLGWSIYEGNHCFHGPCDPTGLTFPKDERSHATGWCAVIGGERYRGACYPDLVGEYIYTDYCRGGLTRARLHDDGTMEFVEAADGVPAFPTSLHATARGELYVTDIYGAVYHVEATP